MIATTGRSPGHIEMGYASTIFEYICQGKATYQHIIELVYLPKRSRHIIRAPSDDSHPMSGPDTPSRGQCIIEVHMVYYYIKRDGTSRIEYTEK